MDLRLLCTTCMHHDTVEYKLPCNIVAVIYQTVTFIQSSGRMKDYPVFTTGMFFLFKVNLDRDDTVCVLYFIT